MGKYMVLYRSTMTAAEQMAQGDPSMAAAVMAEWTKWATRAGDHLVDLGSPLNEAGFVPAGNGNGGTHIGGYSVMQAESVDEVNTLLEGHPHFQSPGASIEVLEFLAIPGMGG